MKRNIVPYNYSRTHFAQNALIDENIIDPLFEYISNNDIGEIEDFLNKNIINLNDVVQKKTGNRIIHYIIENQELYDSDKLELINFFLDRGVSLISFNLQNQTPLHLACKYQFYEGVKLLIDKGLTSINYDSNGMSPLVYNLLGDMRKCERPIKVEPIVRKVKGTNKIRKFISTILVDAGINKPIIDFFSEIGRYFNFVDNMFCELFNFEGIRKEYSSILTNDVLQKNVAIRDLIENSTKGIAEQIKTRYRAIGFARHIIKMGMEHGFDIKNVLESRDFVPEQRFVDAGKVFESTEEEIKEMTELDILLKKRYIPSKFTGVLTQGFYEYVRYVFSTLFNNHDSRMIFTDNQGRTYFFPEELEQVKIYEDNNNIDALVDMQTSEQLFHHNVQSADLGYDIGVKTPVFKFNGRYFYVEYYDSEILPEQINVLNLILAPIRLIDIIPYQKPKKQKSFHGGARDEDFQMLKYLTSSDIIQEQYIKLYDDIENFFTKKMTNELNTITNYSLKQCYDFNDNFYDVIYNGIHILVNAVANVDGFYKYIALAEPNNSLKTFINYLFGLGRVKPSIIDPVINIENKKYVINFNDLNLRRSIAPKLLRVKSNVPKEKNAKPIQLTFDNGISYFDDIRIKKDFLGFFYTDEQFKILEKQFDPLRESIEECRINIENFKDFILKNKPKLNNYHKIVNDLIKIFNDIDLKKYDIQEIKPVTVEKQPQLKLKSIQSISDLFDIIKLKVNQTNEQIINDRINFINYAITTFKNDIIQQNPGLLQSGGADCKINEDIVDELLKLIIFGREPKNITGNTTGLYVDISTVGNIQSNMPAHACNIPQQMFPMHIKICLDKIKEYFENIKINIQILQKNLDLDDFDMRITYFIMSQTYIILINTINYIVLCSAYFDKIVKKDNSFIQNIYKKFINTKYGYLFDQLIDSFDKLKQSYPTMSGYLKNLYVNCVNIIGYINDLIVLFERKNGFNIKYISTGNVTKKIKHIKSYKFPIRPFKSLSADMNEYKQRYFRTQDDLFFFDKLLIIKELIPCISDNLKLEKLSEILDKLPLEPEKHGGAKQEKRKRIPTEAEAEAEALPKKKRRPAQPAAPVEEPPASGTPAQPAAPVEEPPASGTPAQPAAPVEEPPASGTPAQPAAPPPGPESESSAPPEPTSSGTPQESLEPSALSALPAAAPESESSAPPEPTSSGTPQESLETSALTQEQLLKQLEQQLQIEIKKKVEFVKHFDNNGKIIDANKENIFEFNTKNYYIKLGFREDLLEQCVSLCDDTISFDDEISKFSEFSEYPEFKNFLDQYIYIERYFVLCAMLNSIYNKINPKSPQSPIIPKDMQASLIALTGEELDKMIIDYIEKRIDSSVRKCIIKNLGLTMAEETEKMNIQFKFENNPEPFDLTKSLTESNLKDTISKIENALAFQSDEVKKLVKTDKDEVKLYRYIFNNKERPNKCLTINHNITSLLLKKLPIEIVYKIDNNNKSIGAIIIDSLDIETLKIFNKKKIDFSKINGMREYLKEKIEKHKKIFSEFNKVPKELTKRICNEFIKNNKFGNNIVKNADVIMKMLLGIIEQQFIFWNNDKTYILDISKIENVTEENKLELTKINSASDYYEAFVRLINGIEDFKSYYLKESIDLGTYIDKWKQLEKIDKSIHLDKTTLLEKEYYKKICEYISIYFDESEEFYGTNSVLREVIKIIIHILRYTLCASMFYVIVRLLIQYVSSNNVDTNAIDMVKQLIFKQEDNNGQFKQLTTIIKNISNEIDILTKEMIKLQEENKRIVEKIEKKHIKHKEETSNPEIGNLTEERNKNEREIKSLEERIAGKKAALEGKKKNLQENTLGFGKDIFKSKKTENLLIYMINVMPRRIVKRTLNIYKDEDDIDKGKKVNDVYQEIIKILTHLQDIKIEETSDLIKNIENYIIPYFKSLNEIFVKEMKNFVDNYFTYMLSEQKLCEMNEIIK